MLKRAFLAIAAMILAGFAFGPAKSSASTFAAPVASLSKAVVTPPELVRRRYYRRYYRWRPRYRIRRYYYWRPRYRVRRYYYRRYRRPRVYFHY